MSRSSKVRALRSLADTGQLRFDDCPSPSAMTLDLIAMHSGTPIEQRILSGLLRLNITLSGEQRFRLNAREFRTLLDSVIGSAVVDHGIPKVVAHGSQHGLVLAAVKPKSYVFPVARLLAGIRITAPEQFEFGLAARICGLGEFSHLDLMAKEEVQSILEVLNPTERDVLGLRFGLSGEGPQTLERVGTHLGRTRERVRQVQNGALCRLNRPHLVNRLRIAIVLATMARKGNLLVTTRAPEDCTLRFLAEVLSVPITKSKFLHFAALGVDLGQVDLLCRRLEPVRLVMAQDVAAALDDGDGWCLGDVDTFLLAREIASLYRDRLTMLERAVICLETLGRVAHCSEIFAKYCELFPERPTTIHNLHARLSDGKGGVVWVGMRSTFALSKWGYERPTAPLFDEVAQIVSDVHGRTGKPVPFTLIQAEMSKRRAVVNPNSVAIAASLNPEVHWTDEGGYLPGRKPVLACDCDTDSQSIDARLASFERALERTHTGERRPTWISVPDAIRRWEARLRGRGSGCS